MTPNRARHLVTRIGLLVLPLLSLTLLLLVPKASLQQQSHILYVNNADPA